MYSYVNNYQRVLQLVVVQGEFTPIIAQSYWWNWPKMAMWQSIISQLLKIYLKIDVAK